MSEPTNPFAELLARASQGDALAQHELTRQYESELRMVARARLGPALRPYLDTVDLVQSVHKSLLLGLRHDKFDISSPQKLVALALEMLRRKLGRHWRRERRRQRPGPGEGDGDELSRLLADFCSPEPDPAQAAALAEARDRLCRALNETERRMILLRLEGHSTAEVARQLGLDANVLRVRLSRLRQRLRERGVLTDWL
jgi:RNA polymerase sigma-70 factor (ECF subfamily)